MSKQIDIAGAMFNKPHFSASDHGSEGNPPDPAVPTRIRVTLDNLEPYAGNPRTKRNPNYDEIKESIRHRGLDHAPNVTRPTPDQPYMINDGGNTRLEILNELWEETGERKFFEIDCMFRPWRSERDVFVAHIIENEMRGRMSFIDRARAAMRLKSDFETEQGKGLSVRELASEITNLGWSLKHQNLSAMIYAHEKLLSVLSETLDSGMGRPAITSIRKMLTECQTYWDSVAIESDGSFESIWQPIFEEMDGYGAFDLELARDKIEEGIAARLDCPVSGIRAEIQGVAAGYVEAGYRPEDLFKTKELSAPDGVDDHPSPSGWTYNVERITADDTGVTPPLNHEPQPGPHQAHEDFGREHETVEAARSIAHPQHYSGHDASFTEQVEAPSTCFGSSGEGYVTEHEEQERGTHHDSRTPRTPKQYSVDEAKELAYNAAKSVAELCGFGRGVLSAREAGINTPEPYMLHVGSMHDIPSQFQDAALDVFGLLWETTLSVAIHIHCDSASLNDTTVALYNRYTNHEHLDWHLIRLTVAIHKSHPGSLPGMDLRGGSTELWSNIIDAIDHFYWAVGLFLNTYCLEHPEIQHHSRKAPGAGQ